MGLVTSDAGRAREHERRRRALHRHRVGGRRRSAGARGAAGPARDRVPVRRLPRGAARASGSAPEASREAFFMYQEDVDLSLRLRLAGGRLGVEPAAVVDHDYAFAKGRDEVAAARAQPLGDDRALLPGAAAAAARAGARCHRGCAARRRGGRRLAAAEARRGTARRCARCRACCASAARSRPTRAVSAAEFAALADARPRTRRSSAASAALAPLRWGLRAYWRIVLGVLGGAR